MLARLLTPDPVMLKDPVRPNIKPEDRIGEGRDVWFLTDSRDRLSAVLCVAYKDTIPTTEAELMADLSNPNRDNAILYSIWSNYRGAGSALLHEYLKMTRVKGSSIKRIVTMSPKTEMARQFHLKNGAKLLQTNEETVNYEY